MAGVTPRSVFGDRLRFELDRQGISIRKLARKLNPDRPEVARRMLARWIGGYNLPSPAHRVAIALALGLSADAFEDEDDEEADMLEALRPFVRYLLRETYQREARAA